MRWCVCGNDVNGRSKATSSHVSPFEASFRLCSTPIQIRQPCRHLLPGRRLYLVSGPPPSARKHFCLCRCDADDARHRDGNDLRRSHASPCLSYLTSGDIAAISSGISLCPSPVDGGMAALVGVPVRKRGANRKLRPLLHVLML
jgi:hypothetical protein